MLQKRMGLLKKSLLKKSSLVILISILSSGAYAQESTTTAVPETTQPAPARTSIISIGARVENFNYHEPSVSQQGNLYGAYGKFESKLANGNLWRVDGELLTGATDYNGFLQDQSGQPTSTWSQQNQFTVMELNSDYAFNLLKNSNSFGPYLGGGARYTSQDKESQNDYRRQYYYVYASGGLEMTMALSRVSRLRLRGEYDTLVGGANKTFLSDANPADPDITLQFTSGSAVKVGAEYDHRLRSGYGLGFNIYYTSWNIDASQTQTVTTANGVGSWVEPANTTSLTSFAVVLDF